MAPSTVTADEVVAAAGVVLETAFNATQFAAQFAPVPALGPALQAVGAIIQTCQNITSNKLQVSHLQKRCGLLVEALNDPQYINPRSAESLVVISARATAHLRQVQTLLNKHAGQRRWEAFLKQNQISKDIEACHREIDDCCKEFEITSNLQLHQWQEEYSKAYEKDREELRRILEHLAENDAELIQISNETKNQIGAILQLLQTTLRSNMYSPAYNGIRSSLYHVQTLTHELPPEVDLTAGEVRRTSQFAVAGNAKYDIWEGLWLGQERVAMKTLRGVKVSPEDRKRFLREIEVWRKIWDKGRGYILPLYGVSFDDYPYPYMVSPWMNDGSVMDYLKAYPTSDRFDLVKGIAKGIKVLHDMQPPIAHGDIKGDNILIDSRGQPLLADFGLSKMIENFSGVPFTQSRGAMESYVWFAPEMCTPPGTISTCSDVFAFAITIIEMVTMARPYDHIKLIPEVIMRMRAGERPKRPQNMDDRLWEICTACWRHAPDERPSIAWVVEKFEDPTWN